MKLEDKTDKQLKAEIRDLDIIIECLKREVKNFHQKRHRRWKILNDRFAIAGAPEELLPNWGEITFETEYSVKVVDNDEAV